MSQAEPGEQPAPQPGPPNQRPTQRRSLLVLLVAAGIIALLANLLFFATYPLNVGQWDNPTFIRMILEGSSNLTHASGYPAMMWFIGVFVFPERGFPIGDPNPINNRWFTTVQGVQVGIHLALFLISIVLCAKNFGRAVATILALIWGCNVLFMSNVNSAAPEWLQGEAVLLSFLLHAYARDRRPDWKVLVHCLAAVLFAVAYLVKPNSLLFAISVVPFLLMEKETWRFKVLRVAVSAVICVLLISAYAHTYHYRTTRSTQLNYDHGWVMTAAMPPDYLSSPPEQLGIDSLRWSALVRTTPPEYFRADWAGDIDWGAPPEVRETYTASLKFILGMSKAELEQFVKSAPLPPSYSSWGAAIPLNYYYGLAPMDALGVRVYKESLRSHPGHYARNIWNTLTGFFRYGMRTVQTFPTPENSLGYTFQPADFTHGVLGRSKIVPPPDEVPIGLDYFNPRNEVAFYGVHAAQLLNKVTSAGVLYFVLNVTAVLGLFKLKSDLDKLSALSLLAGLGCFVSASAMLLGLRHKELTALAPMYFLFLSICLVAASRFFYPECPKQHRNS